MEFLRVTIDFTEIWKKENASSSVWEMFYAAMSFLPTEFDSIA